MTMQGTVASVGGGSERPCYMYVQRRIIIIMPWYKSGNRMKKTGRGSDCRIWGGVRNGRASYMDSGACAWYRCD